MGLDIVPLVRGEDDRVQFSYGGFHDFRKKLAAAVGIDLMQMAGFGGEEREWPSAEDEPLVHLLHHSDCDGDLRYDECAALVPRLKEIVPLAFSGEDFDTEWMRGRAENLIAACEGVERGDYALLDFS